MSVSIAVAATLALTLSNPTADDTVMSIADSWIDGFARFDPLEARLWGVETGTDRLIGTGRIEAVTRWRDDQRDLLAALSDIDIDTLGAPARAVYVNLRNKLEVNLALETCHRELWSLNHAGGWHLNLMNSLGIAADAAGANLDADLILTWGAQIAEYIRSEQSVLLAGLDEGYSAPQSVSALVASQFESFAAEDSALWSLGDDLPAPLATAWREAMASDIAPAMTAHARFIREDYMPRARESASVATLPNGEACYAASLFQHTGIRFDPAELRALGDDMSETARTRMMQAASALWGLTSEDDVRARVAALDTGAPLPQETIIANAQADTERLIQASARLFPDLPTQQVNLSVYPPEQRQATAASYRPDFSAGYNGTYSLNPEEGRFLHARSSEQVTAHEIAPGHHSQAMMGAFFGGLGEDAAHQILTIGFNNAFVEGWAHYAEILAAEEGLLQHPETEIVFWSEFGDTIPIAVDFNTGVATAEETARRALARRGTPDADLSAADNVLNWLGIMPGQIVSYELGADFFYRQRNRAREALGEDFDYPTFHRLVLEEGSVPLWRIEEKIDAWIDNAR